ncbi:MAG: hypothetical protein PVH17_11080 [Anaerolineae bacterium]|jgi:hypothetical protein
MPACSFEPGVHLVSRETCQALLVEMLPVGKPEVGVEWPALGEEGRPGVYVPLRFDLHLSRAAPEPAPRLRGD